MEVLATFFLHPVVFRQHAPAAMKIPNRASSLTRVFAGASTASPLSQRLPEPPPDLTNIYLLTVLGAGGGGGARGPILSIRSLSDRSVSCRCPLAFADDENGDDEEAGRLAASNPGMKVYASPGYGGGVFAVASGGGRGECAKVWRGTFDEGDYLGAFFVCGVCVHGLAARVGYLISCR